MSLSRRTVLKQLGLIGGGMLFLPGCVKHAEPLSISLKKISITGDQQAMLVDIIDTLIPAGALPGAKALNAHEFVLRMIDDCQSPDNQKIFLTGFADVDARSQKQFNKSFSSLSTPQRESVLIEMEKQEKDNPPADADKKKNAPPTFLSLTKKYTIQGFMQSEYIMTNVSGYNMIPGRFDGCIPMDKNKKLIVG